jgi:hypothetical protein
METLTVQVTCGPNPEDPSKVTITSVVPSTLGLHIGDSATWQVSGLPPDHTVQLLFNFPGDNAPVRLFERVSREPAASEGAPTAVMGVIFSPPDAKQKDYHYDIEVRNPSGTVAVRHDPTIDNLGQPPGPDEGDDS